MYWNNLHAVDLGNEVYPFGINNKVSIVGSRIVAGRLEPFKWTSSRMAKLGIGLDTYFVIAFDVNDSDEISGFYTRDMFDFPRAFIRKGGKRFDLPIPGGYALRNVRSMNERGDVAGQVTQSMSNGDKESESVVWSEGRPVLIENLPGCRVGRAEAVNNSGEAVGDCWNANSVGKPVYQPYTWSSGKTTLLNIEVRSKPCSAVARWINDHGSVVGFISVAKDTDHACLWQQGIRTDLNDEIEHHPGLVLTTAESINNSGQIICNGLMDGAARGFLLTPISQTKSD